MKNFHDEQGISILGIVFFGILLILALSYFQISIRGVAESPESKDNFSYVGATISNIWNNYLRRPATYLWRDVWVEIFWKTFVENMLHLRAGEPTSIESSAPTVSY